jgi:sulfoxide reductase heme-binding subunit YedZ
MWRRIIIFTLSSLPFLWLLFKASSQQLGADPAKTIVLFLGEWGMIFLLLTLSVTPARRWFGWGWLVTHRRMLGLFALFYTSTHFLSYIVFILGLDFGRLAAEIIKRPYITVGFPAIIILFVLGVTSTKKMMRRLGKNWLKLHRLVYLVLFLAWIHVLWQVRSSYFDAVLYGALMVVLLGVRWFWARHKDRRSVT